MTDKKHTPSYTAEFRARGVRLFREHRSDYSSDSAAYRAIASKLGCSSFSLRDWCRRAARDAGELSGPTSEEKARSEPLKAVVHSGAIGSSPMGDGSSPMASALERENRELRQANEILKKGEPMERQWSERHWRTHISLRRSSTALSANDRVHRRSP